MYLLTIIRAVKREGKIMIETRAYLRHVHGTGISTVPSNESIFSQTKVLYNMSSFL